MKKLIFSLALVILFFGFSAFASTVYAYGNASAGVGYSTLNSYYYNEKFVHNVGISQHNGSTSFHYVKAKPWLYHAGALLRAPAPTFRSLPAGGFYPTFRPCTFVSKTPTYNYYNVKKDYVKGAYRC